MLVDDVRPVFISPIHHDVHVSCGCTWYFYNFLVLIRGCFMRLWSDFLSSRFLCIYVCVWYDAFCLYGDFKSYSFCFLWLLTFFPLSIRSNELLCSMHHAQNMHTHLCSYLLLCLQLMWFSDYYYCAALIFGCDFLVLF